MNNRNYPNFCLLIRGKPCSGKTTFVNKINEIPFEILDPDFVDISSIEYKRFKPRRNKNPNEMVKMYCYLFSKAEYHLSSGKNVFWIQPWSRIAEMDLTIRNFGYYKTDLKNKVWSSKLSEILSLLPFKFAICEIMVSNILSEERYKIRKPDTATTEEGIKRLKKTNYLFQQYNLPAKYIKIDGENDINKNATELLIFLKGLAQRNVNPHG